MTHPEISVGIITAPRSVVVIDRSLETYFAQKLPFPHVFAEPGATNFYYRSQVVLHPNGETLGCFGNWSNGVRWLLQNTSTDYIMMCEDDVSWCREGYHTMIPFVKEDRVLTAWTATVNASRGEFGWKPISNLKRFGLCGSLALLFPRKILEKVVDHPIMLKNERIHLDTDIGFSLMDLKVPIFNHQPSLVTHLGAHRSTFDLTVVGEETIDARRCYATCATSGRKYIKI